MRINQLKEYRRIKFIVINEKQFMLSKQSLHMLNHKFNLYKIKIK